jgi:hypothetical protein
MIVLPSTIVQSYLYAVLNIFLGVHEWKGLISVINVSYASGISESSLFVLVP